MPAVTDTKENKVDVPKINPKIEALFKAGAHLGYSKSRRHPAMKNYIFCTRNDVEIFNLQKTNEKLKEAEIFLEDLGKAGKTILWVGSKPPAREHIKNVGKRLETPYVSDRWLGGSLTNFKVVIEERLLHLSQLEKESQSGGFEKYVKKERISKTMELNKLSRMFEGLRNLKSIPDAIIIVDPKEEKTVLSEALNKKVIIISLLNNDCNPKDINYPIPANDNSTNTISIILNHLASAYEKGRKAPAKNENINKNENKSE